MPRFISSTALLVSFAFALAHEGVVAFARTPATNPISQPSTAAANVGDQSVESPDQRVHLNVALDETGAVAFSVNRDGKPLLARSPLGLDFEGTGRLKRGLQILETSRRSVDTSYTLEVPTKQRNARDHFEELTVRLEEREGAGRRFDVVFRAYDDGVAFRYAVPEQAALKNFALVDERSQFHFAADPIAHALPLRNFRTPYENYYATKPLSAWRGGDLIGLPLLLEFKDGPWVAITEADLADYAGCYLTTIPSTDGGPTLTTALSPLLDHSGLSVRATLPHSSPWRVLMIADAPGRLIESTLVLNLNPPSAIGDASWIHTGKVAFPWWNGYVVPAGTPFKGDVNTPTLKYYIDFAAENGIEFVSIDGNVEAWYGGPNTPWLGADVTKPRPDLDMPEVLAYAKSKGVRVRLWMHWQGLNAKLDEALATYERWGIDGVMLDFMERDDQEMVNFYHDVAAKAAAHHLTVNYHGAYKPTGMERTYPNVMNYEAALNLEYNKWSAEQSRGVRPEHELTLPFTRMLAGPMDFHSGGMRSVKPAQFDFRYLAPEVMGTRSRQLARYVVYENPLPMLADDPAAYRGATGFDLLKQVPTTWDETRVLSGTVGDQIVVARKHGNDWWVGAMCADEARSISVPLTFLGSGSFTLSGYADDPSPAAPATAAIAQSSREVTASDPLEIKMVAAGGALMRLTPTSQSTTTPSSQP